MRKMQFGIPITIKTGGTKAIRIEISYPIKAIEPKEKITPIITTIIEEIVALSIGISKVAKILGISAEDGKGYRALTNLSDYGGQEVPHLHFHLFGGEKVGKMVE